MNNLSAQGAEESTQDASVGGGPGETTVEGVSGAATFKKTVEKVENADPKSKAGKRKIADKAPIAKSPKTPRGILAALLPRERRASLRSQKRPLGLMDQLRIDLLRFK
jgi:hypothetical protein